jgi:hypothetical protein
MHAKILFFRESTILNCKKNKISILTQAGDEVMQLEGAVGSVVALLEAGQLSQLQ